MNKISILLAMPDDSQIYQVIAANLRYCGFHVYVITTNNQAFDYPSIWTRLAVKFRQLVLRQHYAKRQLISKILLQKHNNLPDFDYVLFIRGDVFHADFIRAMKHKTRHAVINYQWDGMNRFPHIWQLLPLFDRCYAFNPEDVQQCPELLPATNFYFDNRIHDPQPEKDDFFFVGAHQPDRIKIIKQFSQLAKKHHWKLNCQIWSDQAEVAEQYRDCPNIQMISQRIDLMNMMKDSQQSRVLLDFVVDVHSGLSLRPFEALGDRKKLITTNASIAQYDFYHPDNIYILNEQNMDGIADFLAKPYYELADDIYQKYAFSNWIRYILQIEPYQPINLPKKISL